jgi:putative DNA-invertase from lambdoid prophage Rac
LPRRVQLGQRAVLYCRVSTADQSCARQERDLAAFAERAGYEVIGVFKETASGVRADRAARRQVMALAQRREIGAVLVTELSRWGRSTLDLLHTLQELETWRVSVIAMNGLAFDLATPHGRMMATVLAGVAAFERELIQERIRSGIAAVKARGKRLGRQPGQRPKSDRLAPKVLTLVGQGRSYRLISRELGLSKNTVAEIVKRAGGYAIARRSVSLPSMPAERGSGIRRRRSQPKMLRQRFTQNGS